MRTHEPLFSGDELDARVALLQGWTADDAWIVREYRTDGWRSTMLLVGAIAFIAEAANHHPDLGVHWGKVTVRLQTHSAGGVTEKDLQLADQIERIARWHPTAGFPGLEGQPDGWITP